MENNEVHDEAMARDLLLHSYHLPYGSWTHSTRNDDLWLYCLLKTIAFSLRACSDVLPLNVH